MREIFREAGVELFWIYKTDRFYEYAGGYLKDVKVSDDTVREIRSVMEDSMYRYMRNYFFKNTNSNESLANNWLNEYVGETHPTTGNGIYAISEKNGKQSVVIFCEFKTDYYFEFLNLQKKVDLVFGTSEADKRGLIVIFIVEDYDYFDEYEMKKILNISSKVKFNSPINIIVGGIIGDVFSPIYSNCHLDS